MQPDRLIDGMLDYGQQFRRRPAYAEDPLDTRRAWSAEPDEIPDNLIQYPSRPAAAYGGRRVING